MYYNNYSSNTNRNNNNNNININNGKQIMSSNSNNNIINSNSIKGNFRTPLTPLHRGGRERVYQCGLERLHIGTLRGLQMCVRERVCNCCGRDEFYREGLGGLHGFRLDRFCDNTLRYAFSLIELSIVLIIIGLLVAGVTGGKSLIESAKLNTIIQESRDYRLAFNEAYMNNPNIASDTINERPIIILNSVGESKVKTVREVKNATSLSLEESMKLVRNIPSLISVEQDKLAGFLEALDANGVEYEGGVNKSKFNNGFWYYCNGCSNIVGFENLNLLVFSKVNKDKPLLTLKQAKQILKKYDDGEPLTGAIRLGTCPNQDTNATCWSYIEKNPNEIDKLYFKLDIQ